MGLRFPVVGCATGVSGKQWAQAWLKLREVAGCSADADGSLMTEVLAGGVFGAGRMRTGDGAIILRELLKRSGVHNLEEYGTHSGKATLLSWAAKAGLSEADRKLLGGHADSKDRSMNLYSRDVMAKPLLALAGLL